MRTANPAGGSEGAAGKLGKQCAATPDNSARGGGVADQNPHQMAAWPDAKSCSPRGRPKNRARAARFFAGEAAAASLPGSKSQVQDRRVRAPPPPRIRRGEATPDRWGKSEAEAWGGGAVARCAFLPPTLAKSH